MEWWCKDTVSVCVCVELKMMETFSSHCSSQIYSFDRYRDNQFWKIFPFHWIEEMLIVLPEILIIRNSNNICDSSDFNDYDDEDRINKRITQMTMQMKCNNMELQFYRIVVSCDTYYFIFLYITASLEWNHVENRILNPDFIRILKFSWCTLNMTIRSQCDVNFTQHKNKLTENLNQIKKIKISPQTHTNAEKWKLRCNKLTQERRKS